MSETCIEWLGIALRLRATFCSIDLIGRGEAIQENLFDLAYKFVVGPTELHNAKFTDEIIDKIRDMREDMAMTYQQIAEAVGISKHVIAKICRYERRAQTPHRWIKVIKNEKGD